MPGAPAILQKAVSAATLRQTKLEEVFKGELPDNETAEIQVWIYEPLVSGQGRIDDISLALSLVDEGDERAIGELNALFGEDDLWQGQQRMMYWPLETQDARPHSRPIISHHLSPQPDC